MTYKEFLNIVTFEEVAPHIVNMYPEAKDSLGWFKLHYDMLKQMTPKRHDDSNGDVCHITMKDWDDGTGPHLDAFPMQEHDSKPQNPIIANVLYKSKILESWGRGIGTMVDECKRVGLPAPEFKTDGNFVIVVFKYNCDGVNLQLVNSNPTSTQQVPNKYPTSTQQVPNKYWNLSEY